MTTSSRPSVHRLLLLAAATTTAVALSAGPAAAAPPDNGHDCAGQTVSSAARPGFGDAVSALAQQQLVDDFGAADCGQTNRNNPL